MTSRAPVCDQIDSAYTQYTPAERHSLIGGDVQADAMADCLVYESARINLRDDNVRKLPADRKWRRVSTKRMMRRWRKRRYGNREKDDAHDA